MSPELESWIARALLARGFEILGMEGDTVRVRAPTGQEHALGLGNLGRALALAPPEERPAMVERHLRLCLEQAALAGAGVASEGEAERLFPRLLPADHEAPGMAAPWVEPRCGGALLLALAVDAPETVRLVRPLDLVRWRLPLVEAKRRALANLAASSAELAEKLASRPDPGAAFAVASGDGWDAARLLLLPRLLPAARGALALVPSRDLLLVVPVLGPRDWARARAEALARRRWAAGAVRELPYPLSAELFWCSEGLLERVPLVTGPEGAPELDLPERARALALGEEA